MTPKTTVRWGILGCGDVTEVKSGPALQNVARSELITVMRRDGAKAADYAKRHGVQRSTDSVDELLADPDINAIYVATPPNSHAEYAVRALRAGKDVFLEKPIALNAAECDLIDAAIAETGGRLCVAYYRRALPRFERFKEIIKSGEIGDIRMIEVRQFKRGDDVSPQTWKTDPTVGGGGSFVDMQSHTLDWLSYVFDRPAMISGLCRNQSKAQEAEDLVTFVAEFDGVAVTGLCCYAAAEDEEQVILHGSRGTARMGFFRASPITISVDGTDTVIDLPDPPHVHQPFVERVVAHLLDDAPNPCSAKAGRISTETIDVIFDRAPKQPMRRPKMKKTPSPCIDVCKFKREGHCIGCSMTKTQKSMFKKLKKEKYRAAFVEMLLAQQEVMGKYTHWAPQYEQKCAKKKAKQKP